MDEKKYVNRKMIRLMLITWYCSAALLLLGILSRFMPLIGASAVLMIVCFLLDMRFNRCPYCGKELFHFRQETPRIPGFCSKCGKTLIPSDYTPGDRKDDPRVR